MSMLQLELITKQTQHHYLLPIMIQPNLNHYKITSDTAILLKPICSEIRHYLNNKIITCCTYTLNKHEFALFLTTGITNCSLICISS